MELEGLRVSQVIPRVTSTLESFQNNLMNSSNGYSVEYLGSLEEMKMMLGVTIQQVFESGEQTERIEELIMLNDQLDEIINNASNFISPGEGEEVIIPHIPVEVIEVDLNTAQEEFICTICYDNTEPGEGFKFIGCQHQFCKECLEHYYTGFIESGDVNDIRCPQLNCNNSVHINDVCNSILFGFPEIKWIL